ncbi:MAG: hypothetical protein ACYTAF_04810 [Planctomycetota bacterium]|jgi:hypothetical protein
MHILLPGLLLLLCAGQDLGDPVRNEDHGFSIRMPHGWAPMIVRAPAIVRYGAPGDEGLRVMITVSVVRVAHPTPIGAYRRELDGWLAKSHEGHTPLDDSELRIDGRDAFRKRILTKHVVRDKEGKKLREYDAVVVKSAVRKDYHTFLCIDASYEQKHEDRYAELVFRVIESLRFLPARALSEGEQKGEKALLGWLDGRTALPDALLGESWQAVRIQLEDRKAQKLGHQIQKLEAGEKGYAFTAASRVSFEDGSSSETRGSGTFTADGASQTLEYEKVVMTADKKKHTYRAKLTLRGEKVGIERSIDGVEEKREIAVPRGTFLDLAAGFFRRALALRGEGKYLVRVLRPFRDAPDPEFVEVAAPEKVRSGKEERVIIIVQSTPRRGRVLTYWYDASGGLVRLVTPGSPVSITGAAKEEALGE